MIPPVVVSRCDRLGDLILSLPTLGYLRQAGFDHIVLHCAPYASDIGLWAKFNGLCDELWVAGEAPPFLAKDSVGLCLQLSKESVDGFKSAGLTKTLGPRTKLHALWSFKKSIAQHRSRVEKSEMAYNLDLATNLMKWLGIAPPEWIGLSALKIPPNWHSPRPSPDLILVVSNKGSATNWPVEKYIEVAKENKNKTVEFLVSGSDASVRKQSLLDGGISAEKIVGDFLKLHELIAYLAAAKEVISSSTGPLHIAHAAGVPVLGVFPRDRVQSFKRWRPDGYWHESTVKYVEI